MNLKIIFLVFPFRYLTIWILNFYYLSCPTDKARVLILGWASHLDAFSGYPLGM